MDTSLSLAGKALSRKSRYINLRILRRHHLAHNLGRYWRKQNPITKMSRSNKISKRRRCT